MIELLKRDEELFGRIAEELGIHVICDTEPNFMNFVFLKFKEKQKQVLRVYFKPVDNRLYAVRKEVEKLPKFMNLYLFCFRFIPFFPDLGERESIELGSVSAELEPKNLIKEIHGIMANAL